MLSTPNGQRNHAHRENKYNHQQVKRALVQNGDVQDGKECHHYG